MSEQAEVKYGVVAWFRNFGFITPDGCVEGEQDIFVHYSDINIEGFRTLQKGQRVSFQMGLNVRGQPKAILVTPI